MKFELYLGLILQSKGMACDFSEKEQKNVKKGENI